MQWQYCRMPTDGKLNGEKFSQTKCEIIIIKWLSILGFLVGWLVLDHIEGERGERNAPIWWSRINMSQKFNELTRQFSIYFFSARLKKCIETRTDFTSHFRHRRPSITQHKEQKGNGLHYLLNAPSQDSSRQTWRSVLLCVSRVSFSGAEIPFLWRKINWFQLNEIDIDTKSGRFFFIVIIDGHLSFVIVRPLISPE